MTPSVLCTTGSPTDKVNPLTERLREARLAESPCDHAGSERSEERA